MYSVIKNVFGNAVVEDSNLPFDEAVKICTDVIIKSHGGEAFVVTNQTAATISGGNISETEFVWFGVNGQQYTHAT